MRVNNVPSLTFASIDGDTVKVKGYTTIDEMMKMAYASDLPNVTM